MRRWLSPASWRFPREQRSRRNRTRLKPLRCLAALPLQKAQRRMNDADEHDGEREVKDRDRRGFTASARERPGPAAKLVPVKGSGLSGPFIRRPVMTVLL